ncbi:CDP-glycerol glycerophosphotransferase family protein [Emticicia sp. SJ17W-69]|uniref:CDP-glycerol glycerophosphotransferase family protein n=1 Tax=Emticicia sp. SJ17W-69 TaxID=3421657 RepID=UPI003EBD0B0C
MIEIIKKTVQLIVGFLVYILNPFFSVRKNRWVLGASKGENFNEGSKYILEYINSFDSGIDAVWITQNKAIKRQIRDRGHKCYLNTDLKALSYILTSEVVITCTSFGTDINYCFPKKNRKYVYLAHGMPIKKIIYDQPARLNIPKSKLRHFFYHKFVAAFKISDLNLITSTSDYYTPFLQSAFKSNAVEAIGLPRNDALLNPKYLEKEKWLTGIEGKFVITYMPTHRDYGNGKVSPFLFEGNENVNKFFEENNIVLLIKNHPNMVSKIIDGKNTNNILEISKMGFDAQKVIFHTDLLITDFSSVWIDYLLLKRPVLFYLYDNYEQEDNDTYFDIRKANIGEICLTEEGLYEMIFKIFKNYDSYRPTQELINIHHKFIDDKSCERLYKILIE